MNRRDAIKTALLAGGVLTTSGLGNLWAQSPAATASASPAAPTGPFKLPPLPYAYNALEPHIDTETMHLHHDKHHATYVKKLNEAVAIQPALATMTVEELLTSPDKINEPLRKAVRNQGGGHYNHSLFWQMMKPGGGGDPQGDLAKAITAQFGTVADFKKKFSEEAMSVFGSGWAWLVVNGKTLEIDSTPNQDSPISAGKTPLVGLDVWEHAYYLKNQNRRADYVAAWWNVVDWNFVADRYQKAVG
jgi:Fe-Mn family superoxide dismutase